jgi:hypothetical protein
LVPTSILVSVYPPRTSLCSAMTSSGFFYASDFPSPLVEDSLPALSSLDCPPTNQQEAHWVPSAPTNDQVFSLPPGKSDGPVWNSGLSDFPTLKLLCPTDGRRVCSSHLLRSNLHGQNPEQVLTTPGGSASVVAPIDRTTLPKEDKVDTSSVAVPTAQVLVAQPESKAM